MHFTKVLFTADMLRVDDRFPTLGVSPQQENLSWIYEIFAPLLAGICNTEPGMRLASTQERLAFYEKWHLPFSSAGWASLYDNGTLDLGPFLGEAEETLLISYEMPPYMVSYCRARNLPYIDICMHPIRFLPDYLFGVRSNIPDITLRLQQWLYPDELINTAVRLSRARSLRVYRNRNLVPGSTAFLGQTEIDASLIYNGHLAGTDEIEAALISLCSEYPKVYFKFHPHYKDRSVIASIVAGLGRCSILDVNIYDLFSSYEVINYTSLSSGSLYEAGLFGRQTRRVLPERQNMFTGPEAYVPVTSDILRAHFWQHVLHGTPCACALSPGFMPEPVKFALNLRWGR